MLPQSAEIEMRVSQFGVNFQALLITSRRFLKTIQIFQCDGVVEKQKRRRRATGKGILVEPYGFIAALELAKKRAQIEVGVNIVGR
jgi:hypothetical protein